jgi:D-mannonate dehydratase
VTTFKISKKISQAFLPCWQWTQATTDFKKQQISKTIHFRKQHISKATTNFKKKSKKIKKQEISKNNKFQKTTNFKKQQISKNNRFL